MADRRLREFERAAVQGGAQERRALALARYAAGLCPWCGGEQGVHVLVAEGEERRCCCSMLCGTEDGSFCGPDWSRCDGKASLHCLGCPAVGCEVLELPRRDPRRIPLPGDIIKSLARPGRLVVACGVAEPDGYRGNGPAWRCPDEAHVHWARLAGDTLSPRGGTMSIRGWRSWALGGEVVQRGFGG